MAWRVEWFILIRMGATIKMALKIEYETNYGITCDYAHCVIVDTRWNKEVDEEGNKNKTYRERQAEYERKKALEDAENFRSIFRWPKKNMLH